MAWSSSRPASSEQVVDICDLFQAQWYAMEAWMGVQHYSFTNVLCGRHRVGNTSVLCSDVTSSLSAISSACDTGALALDMCACCYKYYAYPASAWRPVDYYNPAACANLPQTYATASATLSWVNPSNNADKVNHSVDWPSTAGLFEFYPGYYEITDHMSAYASATSQQQTAVDEHIVISNTTVNGFGKYYWYFTPPDDGLYLINVQYSLSSTSADELYGTYLYFPSYSNTYSRREVMGEDRPCADETRNISIGSGPTLIYLTKGYPVYLFTYTTDITTGHSGKILSASNWLDVVRIA